MELLRISTLHSLGLAERRIRNPQRLCKYLPLPAQLKSSCSTCVKTLYFYNLGFGEPDRYHVPDMRPSSLLLCHQDTRNLVPRYQRCTYFYYPGHSNKSSIITHKINTGSVDYIGSSHQVRFRLCSILRPPSNFLFSLEQWWHVIIFLAFCHWQMVGKYFADMRSNLGCFEEKFSFMSQSAVNFTTKSYDGRVY